MEAIVEARKEYMYLLQECINPVVMQTFLTMWESSDGWNKISKFKETMNEINSWGDNTVDLEVDKIKSECDYLDKLIEASVVVRVQIMNSVKIGKHSGKLKLNIPSDTEFIRKVYRYAYKELVKNCEFMKDDDTREIKLFDVVTKAIDLTIRSYVPLHSIIQRNLTDEYTIDEPSPQFEPEPRFEPEPELEPGPEDIEEPDLLIKE